MLIPEGYELTEEGKKWNEQYKAYTPEQAAAHLGTLAKGALVQKIGTGSSSVTTPENQALLEKQQGVLTNKLDTEKSKELTRLDDILASRGISRSGAVGAGTAEIAKNYADALASGLVGLDTDMATLNLQQKNQDMMSKYYDAMIKNMTSNQTGTSGKIVNLPTTNPFTSTTSYSDWSKMYPNRGSQQEADNESGTIKNTTKKAIPASAYQLYKG